MTPVKFLECFQFWALGTVILNIMQYSLRQIHVYTTSIIPCTQAQYLLFRVVCLCDTSTAKHAVYPLLDHRPCVPVLHISSSTPVSSLTPKITPSAKYSVQASRTNNRSSRPELIQAISSTVQSTTELSSGKSFGCIFAGLPRNMSHMADIRILFLERFPR